MLSVVTVHDLEFEKRWIEGVSSTGKSIARLVKIGMPKVPQHILHCVFFLYRSRDDAEHGRDPQGTGFFVGAPSQAIPNVACPPHVYAITNQHVVTVAPFIRVNTVDGKTDVIALDPAIDWHFVPGGHPHQGDDAAIAPVEFLDHYQAAAVMLDLFVMDYRVAHYEVGVGEDAFMIGLFADHDGHTTNIPKARFGHISMMPNDKAPIEQPNGTTTKSSYVVDMHSRTGFSGSPVFFYRTLGADLAQANRTNVMLNQQPLFGLLGLHWGQFPEEFTSTDEHHRTLRLEGMSGMTCVIPAWRLFHLLNLDELKAMRVKREEEQRKDPKLRGKPRAESVRSKKSDSNPTHREDFNRLLGAAVKRPKSSD